MSSKIVKKTFILVAAGIISKIIGILYVIPFHRLVGTMGQTLYYYSYVPYTIFIMLATAGFPQGIAKMTAKYLILEEHDLNERVFRAGRSLMMLLGVLAFIVLYFLAEVVAKRFNSDMYNVKEIASVIRVVSTALIVIPLLSFTRGYLQGHGQMVPTAISQVVEQIVRVILLLVGAYFFINEGVVKAIYVATFSAFGSALVALLVMLYFSWKVRKENRANINYNPEEVDYKQVYAILWNLFKISLPFIFISQTLPLFSLFDSFLLNKILQLTSQKATGDLFLSMYNLQVQQLIMIPMALATAMQVSSLPTISATMAIKNYQLLNKQLNEIILVLLFFVLPSSFAISLLAEPLYTLFYEHHNLGTLILRLAAPTIILFSLLTVTSSILQGMNRGMLTVINLLIGLLVKLLGNLLLIWLIGSLGTVFATGLGFGAIALLNLLAIYKKTLFINKTLLKQILVICIISAGMLVLLGVLLWVTSFFIVPNTSVNSLIILLICIPIATLFYLYLALRTGILKLTLGLKAENLTKKIFFYKN